MANVKRRDLLRIERGRDADFIALAIRRVLAYNPTASLAEIEMTFRAAAGTAYIIAGEPFSVVIGFSNWHSALGRLGMTAEMSRAVLAGEPNTPARSGGRRQCAQSPPPIGGIAALGLQMRLFRHDAAAPKFARVFPVERGVERGVADRAPIKAAPQHLVFPAMLGPLLQAARRCNRLSLGSPRLKQVPWSARFFDPIMLPDGAEHEAADWQVAMEALLLVGERDAPIKMAQIAVMKALKRHNPLSLGSAALLIPLRPCRRLGLLQRLLAGED